MEITWAFIYVAPGSDPTADRAVVERDGVRNIMVPVPDPSLSPEIAVELVDEGARLIELCGVHGLPGAAKVIEAVGDRAPVGVVTFGPEAIEGLTAFRTQFAESQAARVA
jgi:Family of unknown function (DUF6506)